MVPGASPGERRISAFADKPEFIISRSWAGSGGSVNLRTEKVRPRSDIVPKLALSHRLGLRVSDPQRTLREFRSEIWRFSGGQIRGTKVPRLYGRTLLPNDGRTQNRTEKVGNDEGTDEMSIDMSANIFPPPIVAKDSR